MPFGDAAMFQCETVSRLGAASVRGRSPKALKIRKLRRSRFGTPLAITQRVVRTMAGEMRKLGRTLRFEV
jgi:hypothetical protein